MWHLLKPVSNVQEFTPLWDPKVYNLAFVEAYLKSARIHPTLRLKSIQSGIFWSLSQMCKNSPHLETGKSDMSLCSCFCDMSMDQSKAVPTHLHFDRCVCRKIEWNWIWFNCIFSTSFLHAAVKMRIGDNCIWWVCLCAPGPWLMPDPIWVSFLTYSGLPPLTICSISGCYLYQYKNCF